MIVSSDHNALDSLKRIRTSAATILSIARQGFIQSERDFVARRGLDVVTFEASGSIRHVRISESHGRSRTVQYEGLPKRRPAETRSQMALGLAEDLTVRVKVMAETRRDAEVNTRALGGVIAAMRLAIADDGRQFDSLHVRMPFRGREVESYVVHDDRRWSIPKEAAQRLSGDVEDQETCIIEIEKDDIDVHFAETRFEVPTTMDVAETMRSMEAYGIQQEDAVLTRMASR